MLDREGEEARETAHRLLLTRGGPAREVLPRDVYTLAAYVRRLVDEGHNESVRARITAAVDDLREEVSGISDEKITSTLDELDKAVNDL